MDLSVRCVVDVFGLSDFTDAEIAAYPCGVDNTGPDSPLNLLIRHALYPFDDIRATMSPINWIAPEKHLPPTLIVHGDRDNMCSFPHSVALYKKLCECGQSADFIMVRNALHGTRIWIPAMIDAILAFLKAHL